jgi:hypothetical protein
MSWSCASCGTLRAFVIQGVGNAHLCYTCWSSSRDQDKESSQMKLRSKRDVDVD